MAKPFQKNFTKTMEQGMGETRKPIQRSLQENHQEILNNLMSTIVGKPTIVEAQRVLKVIDQLILNLETFMYLDADLVQRFYSGKFQKDIIQNLTEETLQLLQKQAEIEQKFKFYVNLDQVNKEGEEIDEAKKQESERLEKLLQENFRNLIRRIQHSPKDLEILRLLKSNLNPELNDLVHCVKCIRIVMLKKLSTAEEEQRNHVAQLEDLKQKISSYEKTKNQCEQDLQKLRSERAIKTNEKKEEIERLKSAIAEVKATKVKRQTMLKDDTNTKLGVLEKDHKSKEDKLGTEFDLLKKRFQKMKEENAVEETGLKRKKAAQDQAYFESIQLYDQTMEQGMARLQELQQECADIEKDLKDKQNYFRAVDSEKAREREIEEEFKRKRELHQINLDKKVEAAKHIQYFLNQVKKPSKKGGAKPKK
ncbi:hypothetical protein pb186bvf_005260 [Paramecium bursaria]